MNCLRSRAGIDGCTVSSVGVPPSSMTGAKFLKMSNGRLGSMAGRVTNVFEMITSVEPSAGARATRSAPMTPEAPGRFSTTMVVPKAGPSSLLTVRASTVERAARRERHDEAHLLVRQTARAPARKPARPPGSPRQKSESLSTDMISFEPAKAGTARPSMRRIAGAVPCAGTARCQQANPAPDRQPAMGAAVPSICTRKPDRTFGQ